MKLKVQPAVIGGGATGSIPSFYVHCGQGHQILRWLGHVACARLAYKQGLAQGYYVPQSLIDREGNVLDADLVLNEVAADGDQFVVEVSEGPAAFTTRWEGRPKSPSFAWDESTGGEVVVAPDAWLSQLDLVKEDLGALADPELVATDPEGVVRDLDKVKGLLVQYAGALQMLMLLYSGEASTPLESLQRLSLPQFKLLLGAARATASPFPTERLDELFANVLSTPGALSRRTDCQAGYTMLELPDFMVALVHVAHMRYHAGSFAAGAAATPLSTKLLSLLQDCFSAALLPDMQRRVDKLRTPPTPGAQLLLRKGRRLTEQVLERCQVKRVKAAALRVDLRAVAKHLSRWGLLGKEIMLPELMPVAIFALQPQADPHRYTLHPRPLGLDYDQFERLLLGYARLLAWARKRGDAFEEFLGELLDGVFKKAGVLLELPTDDGGDGM